MYTDVIAKLVGQLTFQVNATNLRKFQQMLTQVEKQMRGFTRQVERLDAKLNGLGKKASTTLAQSLKQQRALSREAFKEQLQASKLQLAQDKNRIATAKQQTLLDIQQAKLRANTATYSLRHEQQALQVASARQRTLAAEHRQQSALFRLQATAARTQRQLERSTAGQRIKNSHGAITGSLERFAGRFESRGGNLGLGAASGMGSFLGAFSTASVAVSTFAIVIGAATAAVTAFVNRTAEISDQYGKQRAQLNVAAGGNAEEAKSLEKRVGAVINYLGMNREKTAPDFIRSLTLLSKEGMNSDKSLGVVTGVSAYGKALGVEGDRIALALNAIGQSISKGQLMSEEFKSQLSEHLPGANMIGAQTWARLNNRQQTDAAASRSFAKDMKDGLITGDILKRFWEQFGEALQKEAYKSGLETIISNNESASNRRQNAIYEAFQAANEANDGALMKAQAEWNDNLGKLIAELRPLIVEMGEAGAKFLDGAGGVADTLTELAKFYNGKKSAFDGFMSPETAASTKALFNELVGTGQSLLTIVQAIGKGWSGIFKVADESGVLAGVEDTLTACLSLVNSITKALEAMTQGKYEIALDVLVANFKGPKWLTDIMEAGGANVDYQTNQAMQRGENMSSVWGFLRRNGWGIQGAIQGKDGVSQMMASNEATLSKLQMNKLRLPDAQQLMQSPNAQALMSQAQAGSEAYTQQIIARVMKENARPIADKAVPSISIGDINLTIEGTNLTPEQIIPAVEGQMEDVARRFLQDTLRRSMVGAAEGKR